MKYTHTCPCCMHKETAYLHKINEGLVLALKQLQMFYDKEKRAANLQKDLELTKNQYNNFQKLQYFYVVKRTEEGWYPSTRGRDFLAGLLSIPSHAATMNGEVLTPDHEAWETHSKDVQQVMVTDFLSSSYKTREEYQEEKGSNQLTIC